MKTKVISSPRRLAAANYSDSQDSEHAPVYYQDDSLNIWKADRENSSTAWTRKQVNMAGINPKKGTPLTAFGLPEDTVSATHQPLPHAGT